MRYFLTQYKKAYGFCITVLIMLCLSVSVQANLRVSKQPKSVKAKYAGQDILFECKATGDGGIRYQWQEKTKASSKWKNLKGETYSFYRLCSSAKKNGSKYRCKIRAKSGKPVYTKAVKLKVPLKPVFKLQPENALSRKSGTAVFTVKVYDSKNVRLRWQVNNGKGWKYISYAYGPSLNVTASLSTNGCWYRCEATQRQTKKKRYSVSVTLKVTDIGARYWYDLPEGSTNGLFLPRALDGHIYVAPYLTTYSKYIQAACKRINACIGSDVFVYTISQHIADIIVIDYCNPGSTEKNMYMKNSVYATLVSNNGSLWAGVAFSDDLRHEHFLIALNRYYLDHFYDEDALVGVIVHELGHCIGIGHSSDKNSVMYCKSFGSRMTAADVHNFKGAVARALSLNQMCGVDDNGLVAACRGR